MKPNKPISSLIRYVMESDVNVIPKGSPSHNTITKDIANLKSVHDVKVMHNLSHVGSGSFADVYLKNGEHIVVRIERISEYPTDSFFESFIGIDLPNIVKVYDHQYFPKISAWITIMENLLPLSVSQKGQWNGAKKTLFRTNFYTEELDWNRPYENTVYDIIEKELGRDKALPHKQMLDVMDKIFKQYYQVTGEYPYDIHHNNVMQTSSGVIKLIDL
jgi:hypothetical protein